MLLSNLSYLECSGSWMTFLLCSLSKKDLNPSRFFGFGSLRPPLCSKQTTSLGSEGHNFGCLKNSFNTIDYNIFSFPPAITSWLLFICTRCVLYISKLYKCVAPNGSLSSHVLYIYIYSSKLTCILQHPFNFRSGKEMGNSSLRGAIYAAGSHIDLQKRLSTYVT